MINYLTCMSLIRLGKPRVATFQKEMPTLEIKTQEARRQQKQPTSKWPKAVVSGRQHHLCRRQQQQAIGNRQPPAGQLVHTCMWDPTPLNRFPSHGTGVEWSSDTAG